MKNPYRCVELDPASNELRLGHRSIPPLGSQEVLVKVWGSPINPSDRLFCKGLYGTRATSLTVPGFEGTGTVVATGSGLLARRLLGKRISGAIQGKEGFWAEYVVLPAHQCLSLPESISNETAACAFVNPLTALALLEPIRKRRFNSLLQTGAASQLGRMIYRMCQTEKIPCVHVVHRPEIKAALLKEGYREVLDSSTPSFESDLTRLIHEYQIQYVVDAVAGSMTNSLAQALPKAAEIVVYGVLSGKNCEINPGDLIFKNISVRGFWLAHWLESKNPLQMARVFYDLKKILQNEGQTQVSRVLSLEEAIADLKSPNHSDSFGKTLINPAL